MHAWREPTFTSTGGHDVRLHYRVPCGTLAAALVLALAVASSSAATFTLGPEAFSARWSSLTFELAGNRVACPVTLEGSFSSSSFTATAGTRIGSIARASLGTCSTGTATILTETLPWAVQYSSFTGTLPNITSLTDHVIGAAIRGSSGGLSCLIRSTEANPVSLIAERLEEGSLTGTRLDERLGIPAGGGGLCELAGEAHASGTGTIAAPGGEAVEVLEGNNGTDLVANVTPPEIMLLPVAVGANGNVTLSMTNRSGWLIRLRSVALTGGNMNRYILENVAERCVLNTELRRARENQCRIRIGREANAMAGQNVTVRIEFLYPGWFLGVNTYTEQFVVVAS